MLYDILNKVPATTYNNPEALKNKHIFTIIEKIAETAELNNKQYIIGGGGSLAIYYDKIIRKHKDLDLYILKEDLDFWRGFLQSFNLDIRKNNWNENYHAYIVGKKTKYKLIDINFTVPMTIWDEKKQQFRVGTVFSAAAPKYSGVFALGSTIDHVPYITKYGIRILPPEIVKEQKIGRFFTKTSFTTKKRDEVDFAEYFDMTGMLLAKEDYQRD